MFDLRRFTQIVLPTMLVAAFAGSTPARAEDGPALAVPPVVIPAVPEDPPAPVVRICVRVAATAAAGQELEYHLCVENCSPAPAHHVLVRNPLPENARFVRSSPEPYAKDPELLWRLGTLAPGAKCEITLFLMPTNTADVKNCARVQFEHGQCVCTRLLKPGLTLHKTGPTQAAQYDVLPFRLTLTNSGATELRDLTLTDTLPAGLEHASGQNKLTWHFDTLAPGQTQHADYQVVAKAAGKLCNRAEAVAQGVKETAESCVVITEPRLALAVTGPKRQFLNMPATYQVVVSNAGTVPLANVVVTNPIPAGTSLVRATAGGELAGNQLHWSVGTLDPGASRTFDVQLKAQNAGRICDQATATADRGLTQKAEACTDFAGFAALSLEVIDSDDPLEVGGTTTYSITVRNPGMTAATAVQITAAIPRQLELVSASGPARYRTEGAKVVFEPVTVAPGASVQYRVDAKARQAGDIRFHVELTADQLRAGGPVIQEESTTVYVTLPASRRKVPGLPPPTFPTAAAGYNRLRGPGPGAGSGGVHGGAAFRGS